MALRDASTPATSGNGTSTSCLVPTGMQPDDIVLIFESDDAAQSNIAFPSFFTSLNKDYILANGENVGCAWKREGSTVDSSSYTVGHGTVQTGGAIGAVVTAVAFSGRDTGNPPVLVSSIKDNGTVSGTRTVSLSGTAVAGDDLVFVMVTDVQTPTSVTFQPPTGFTEVASVPQTGYSHMSVSIKENVAAGSTGTISGKFTPSSGGAGYVGYLIRVPAAPPSTTPVSTTRSTQWRTLASRSTSRATSFRTLKSLSASRTSAWRVLSRQAATQATSWRTLVTTTLARSTSWRTLITSMVSRSASWAVAELAAPTQVVISISSSWRTLETLSLDQSTGWRTLTLVYDERTTSWRTLETATASVSSVWAVSKTGAVIRMVLTPSGWKVLGHHSVG